MNIPVLLLLILGPRVSGPKEVSKNKRGDVSDTKMDEGKISAVCTTHSIFIVKEFTNVRQV